VKLSIYEFKGLRRVYTIIELQDREKNLLNYLSSLGEEELMEVMTKVFGKLRVLKYGKGALVGDEKVGYMFIELELEDYSIYTLEVYPAAITLIADSSFSDLKTKASRLVNLIS